MRSDPIIEEVYAIKAKVAEEVDYDLDKLWARLRENAETRRHRTSERRVKRL